MAQKAIIHKASVQVSNLDDNIYADHQLTIARHPSETDERMMIRVLAYALNAPHNSEDGTLEFTKDMFEPDEPCLWHKDYTDFIQHWIDLGQPDEKRIMRASGRCKKVTLYTYGAASAPWWAGISTSLSRAKNVTIWQLAPEHSEKLASLANRAMILQVTIQDGMIYVESEGQTAELTLVKLM